MILSLLGCMTLDGFFFNGTPVDGYTLGGDIIPSTCVQEESYSVDANTTLWGVWVHQPPAVDADCNADEFHATAPRLLYFHGNGENIDHYWNRMEAYWSLGYETFTYDYRGYGKSDGDPTYDNTLADGLVTIDHVADVSGTPPEEMAYLGLSLGGFVAIHDIPKRPPRRFISEDMFASVQKMLDDGTLISMPSGWMLEEEWSNVDAAKALPADIPYLVMHGDSDLYIQPEHAKLVYAAAASDIKDLWWVKGSDHGMDFETDPDGYNEHVRCWVEEVDPTVCVGK